MVTRDQLEQAEDYCGQCERRVEEDDHDSAPGFSRQQDIKQQVDYQVHDLSQKENDTDEDAERRVDQESTGHKCGGDCDNEKAGETIGRHDQSPSSARISLMDRSDTATSLPQSR